MSFYDGVKESIREENGEQTEQTAEQADDADGDVDDMAFDELKKGADNGETEQPEKTRDDTEIEVLTENGLEPVSGQQTETAAGTGQPQQSQGQPPSHSQDPAASQQQPVNGDESADIVPVLEDIREQNRQIIEILKTIDRRLQ